MSDLRTEYHVNQDPEGLIPRLKNFCLDMDGTVYLDTAWIDGAPEFLARLKETGRKYCFMTNNSSKNAASYVEKLHKMGLDIDPGKELITSGHATIDWLKKHCAGKKVFLFGNRVLKEEFEERGIVLDETRPDMVVTAFAQEFDYRDLCVLCDLVRSGMPYIATHPDFNCPTRTGFIPDIGSLSAYVCASTGRMPDRVIGKPNREIIDYTLGVLGAAPEETAVVGDRLYTDIRSGVGNGLYGIFVLSGEAGLSDLPDSDVQPSLVFDSVKELIPFL